MFFIMKQIITCKKNCNICTYINNFLFFFYLQAEKTIGHLFLTIFLWALVFIRIFL